MPTINLVRGQDGKLTGMTERDCKGYAKFRKRVEELAGGILTFTWKEPRSGPYHRRHFAMIGTLFAAQDVFTDDQIFRKWLEVGAGYAEFLPGRNGVLEAYPKSIEYAALDQAEFEPIHDAVFGFARSEYARQRMWPHMTSAQSWDMIESVLGEFY